MKFFWTKDNRYYKLLFHLTLFGTIDVVSMWGRIGSKLGGYKVISCRTSEEVAIVVETIKRRRKYRGYK